MCLKMAVTSWKVQLLESLNTFYGDQDWYTAPNKNIAISIASA